MLTRAYDARTVVSQNPKAREMRNNFDNDNKPKTDDSAPAATGVARLRRVARGIRNNFSNDNEAPADAGAERDVFASSEAGGKGGDQGEGTGDGRRFRWVARVASRVSKVGKRAKGRVAKIVRNEEAAEGQQEEGL